MHKRVVFMILAGCIFLAGCALLLYPPVSQWLNSLHESEMYADYADEMFGVDDASIEEELEKARAYNQELADTVTPAIDPFAEPDQTDTGDYDQLLNFTADGVMGYLEIPDINVMLPIYHGVGTYVLSKGIGHLPETSLPVGGVSTHAVLAGHSGMCYARLLTDLPKLEYGDYFYIHIYNQDLVYQVDQIKRVLPTDTSDLQIIEGEDHVTLITCVPIGVNSHRLLVRGTRVPDSAAASSAAG